MTLHLVKNDDVTLATESFGTSQRGSILLVMGATASMLWWSQPLCQSLADHGYQVIRFDHRDTGLSTTGEPGSAAYDLEDMASDILAIIDDYQLSTVHLVGMSLGALLSQVVALQHADRVASLTLIAAEPLGIDYEGAGISADFLDHFGSIGTLDWSDREAVITFLLTIARLSAGSAPKFDETAARIRIENELERSSSIASAFNHALIAGALTPDLKVGAGALTQPILLIHGTEDPIVDFRATEAIQRAVPNAKIVALQGRGHELAPSDVPYVVDAIVRFVAD